MALLGVQPWEEVGDYKFQAIAEGKNLEVVLEGWKLRHLLSQDAVDLLQVFVGDRVVDIFCTVSCTSRWKTYYVESTVLCRRR